MARKKGSQKKGDSPNELTKATMELDVDSPIQSVAPLSLPAKLPIANIEMSTLELAPEPAVSATEVEVETVPVDGMETVAVKGDAAIETDRPVWAPINVFTGEPSIGLVPQISSQKTTEEAPRAKGDATDATICRASHLGKSRIYDSDWGKLLKYLEMIEAAFISCSFDAFNY
jgi:hypothetical protein